MPEELLVGAILCQPLFEAITRVRQISRVIGHRVVFDEVHHLAHRAERTAVDSSAFSLSRPVQPDRPAQVIGHATQHRVATATRGERIVEVIHRAPPGPPSAMLSKPSSQNPPFTAQQFSRDVEYTLQVVTEDVDGLPGAGDAVAPGGTFLDHLDVHVLMVGPRRRAQRSRRTRKWARSRFIGWPSGEGEAEPAAQALRYRRCRPDHRHPKREQ